MRIVSRIAMTIVAMLLLGALALGQQQPPAQIPLGDLVKQQKSAQKAKKVITDDDMPARAPDPAAAPIATAAGESTDAPPADAADGKPGVNPEGPKLSEAEMRQSKITALKESEEGERRIVARMEDALADPDLSDNRRRMYSEMQQHAREMADKFAKEREELERQGNAPKPQQPGAPK